jgi:PAS domain S-box-containing protein
MSSEKILLIISEPSLSTLLDRGVLKPAGYDSLVASDRSAAEDILKECQHQVVMIGDRVGDDDGIEFGAEISQKYPGLPLVLISKKPEADVLVSANMAGFVEILTPPLRPSEVIRAVQEALLRYHLLTNWVLQGIDQSINPLQKRLESLEALQRVARSVTSLLDLDSILTSVVESAVNLTGAEEGSLLLLDETTGELYMRAALNFQDEFVRKFRLPIQDTLAGQVMHTGKPVVINESTPQKIKTSYLVHTLIYVPLQVHNRVIGVLGVDSRKNDAPFLDEHIEIVAALADFAAIAIENARSYERVDVERSKLETILTKVQDGVIVVGHEGELILANQSVRSAFNLGNEALNGQPVVEIIQNSDLLEVFEEKAQVPSRSEIQLQDGRVFNAQVSPIPEVGKVITMQDITHLKELDRIKSDFVHTVSHDLRSPLTAILGYVELLERAGPVTAQQREFIRRVQVSVSNITALINDLLDLGRIEAGFDTRKEIVSLAAVVQYAVDSLRHFITEKEHQVMVETPPQLPAMFGNPIRLKQMVANLISNAIKFTPQRGTIKVNLEAQGNQVILQVSDNGPGIPVSDQPYIFDKFYRGANVSPDMPGTGLGLAIVKSIVDYHQGRIWVESVLGEGTTFTTVFPTTDHEL